MKPFLSLLFLVLLTVSCTDDAVLTFVPKEYHADTCEGCPTVEVNLPEASNGDAASNHINAALQEVAIATLSPLEETEVSSIDEAIDQFKKQFDELKEDYEQAVPWEVTLDGEVSYQSESMVSIRLNSYSFTGGAHGYGATSFVNFDAMTGEQLEVEDLFSDLDEFTSYCEQLFRAQEHIAPERNINATGFFFEGDAFHLPENIGFTENGLLLIYNAYEIASYADGQKMVEIPLAEASKFLKKLQ